MKKSFYVNASVAVIGSSLFALLVSIIYFIVSINVDDATSLMVTLGLFTDFFNAVSMFIGFGTIIYAFFKFGFYEGIMSILIVLAAFVPYFIYQSVAWNVYAKYQYGVVVEGTEAFSSAIMGIYYSMGQGIVNQIIPALIVAFIVCKVVKTNKDKPTKYISWKNKLQRAMITVCISLTCINLVMLVLTGILPELAGMGWVMTKAVFNEYIVTVFISIGENLVIYLPIQYIVLMSTYSFYERRLNPINKI
jgi:hypothetical protein